MLTADPAASWTISIALAIVFGTSTAIKFADFEEFCAAVANYRIVPESIAAIVAALVPIAEITGAVGILIPRTHRAGAAVLFILLAIFTAAIVVNLMRGRLHVDCGCFGPAIRQPLSWWLPAHNTILMALVAIATLPTASRSITPLDIATIAFGTATLVIL